MIDVTGFSGYAFTILRLAFVILAFVSAWNLAKRLRAHASGVEGGFVTKYDSAIRANGVRTLTVILLLATVGIFLSREGAYRPKTTLTQPADSTSVDRAVPEFQSEPGKPTWEEVQRQNREENEKARQDFEAVPAQEK